MLLLLWFCYIGLMLDMKWQNNIYVIPADKFTWSKFERTKCGPQGERQDACNNRVSSKSLIRIPLKPLDSHFRALLSGIIFAELVHTAVEGGFAHASTTMRLKLWGAWLTDVGLHNPSTYSGRSVVIALQADGPRPEAPASNGRALCWPTSATLLFPCVNFIPDSSARKRESSGF